MSALLVTALTAAIAAIATGAVGFCMLRLWGGRQEDWRSHTTMIGLTLATAGVALQSIIATFDWDHWLLLALYPALKIVGFLMVAGAVSFPRCGHRGWLALAACGAGAAVVSLVF